MAPTDEFRVTLNWYDFKKGFEDTNPGWYIYRVPYKLLSDAEETIRWLYKHVDNPETHCRWYTTTVMVHVKFRYERDYLWFKLAF